MEEEEIYHLSPEELEAVQEGIWQIENGLFISHEEANKKVEELLKNNDFADKSK
jgi:predicted transcriptional regulator